MKYGIVILQLKLRISENNNAMNIKSFLTTAKACVLYAGVLMATTLGFQGCTENMEEGSFAIKVEPTLADFLNENSEFSKIVEIFSEVPLSPFQDEDNNASPIISALSARGNYTVFAPTNKTVEAYAKLHHPEGGFADLTDEEKKILAYSCIIDNGNDDAFESIDFPRDGSAFTIADLNDRLITCEQVVTEDDDYFVLNGTTIIENSKRYCDRECSNGYIHIIREADNSAPIAPSNKSVADLIGQADNLQGWKILLAATGWDENMSVENADFDVEYESTPREETYKASNDLKIFNIAQHRYLGFTAFVETDDVLESALGVSVSDKTALIEAIRAKAEAIYGETDKDNLKSPDNAVNRFVAYHLIDAKIPYNKLVVHLNEYGYLYKDFKNPQTEELTLDVWDYYATAGKHRSLLKISQDGDKPVRATSHGVFLNRVSSYSPVDYHTLSVRHEGVRLESYNKVGETTFDNNAKNGFYYPIQGLLLEDADTREALGSERIRFDMTTILPELLSGNYRGGEYTHFPNGFFNNITGESNDTKLLYLTAAAAGGTNWIDYQGDEFMALGVFDFVLKLPPVPEDGNYEVRMAVNSNTLRGMAQLYLGTSPDDLLPLGLPLDLRQSIQDNDNIGYVADGSDENANSENDKVMRNHGYMKGPRYFQRPDNTGTSASARQLGAASTIRRIIVPQQRFEKDKTYYLRFKSVLNKSDAQFMIDYFEFCPTSVFNGAIEEDQW